LIDAWRARKGTEIVWRFENGVTTGGPALGLKKRLSIRQPGGLERGGGVEFECRYATLLKHDPFGHQVARIIISLLTTMKAPVSMLVDWPRMMHSDR